MRKIEFRAWNKAKKFMDTAWLIDWEHGQVCHRSHNVSQLENCILMQYTGLKDKNGKEIYEGDILEISMGTGSPLRCSIEYKAPSFCRRWIDKVSRNHRPRELEPMAWNTHIIYKVIGNIYENPELLAGESNEH